MTMEEIIRRKLTDALSPSRLEIINQSHLHAGHSGDDGSGESHFHVTVVTPAFADMSRLERQKTVYKILSQELENGIHALSISALDK